MLVPVFSCHSLALSVGQQSLVWLPGTVFVAQLQDDLAAAGFVIIV